MEYNDILKAGFFLGVFILFGFLVVAVDLVPSGNINLKGIWNITNLNYVSSFNLSGSLNAKNFNITNVGTIIATYFSGDGSKLSNLNASGSNTQIQFNDGGVLGGNASFYFDKTNNQFFIGFNQERNSFFVDDSVTQLGNYLGKFEFVYNLATVGIFDFSGVSTPTKTYSFPNNTGTIALLSDINSSWNESRGNQLYRLNNSQISWSNLTDYPSECPANTYLTQLNDSVTCTAISKITNNLNISGGNVTIDSGNMFCYTQDCTHRSYFNGSATIIE